MTSNVKPIPEHMHSITPHLVCANAMEAIEFYKRAFGATDTSTLFGKDGKLMHGEFRIGDSVMMIMEEHPEWNAKGPKMLGGSPVTLHLYVKDADEVHARAVKEGATSIMVPTDMFWGDRYGVLTDPFGHTWAVATHVKDLSMEEISAGALAMGDCGNAMPQ